MKTVVMKWRIRRIAIGIVLLITCVAVNAQTTVVLEEYETRSQVITAQLGEELGEMTPVTIGLNVENGSSGHRDWYSVSGWYQYEGKNQPRIPLVGIYTYDLTLYHFNDEALMDSVVNFGYDDYDRFGFMEMMERYHTMGDFLEKITFGRMEGTLRDREEYTGGLQGEWTDGDTSISLVAFNTDLHILQHHSVLNIHHRNRDFRVALNRLGIPTVYPGEYSIEGYKVVDDTLRVVLSYDRTAAAYALGMCGAGSETGFLWLELDEEGRLLTLEDYLLESCLQNIHSESGYRDENEENYIVTDNEGLGWYLTLDRRTMTLEWEPGG